MRPNLDDYEPVEVRLARFWAQHPAGRVATDLVRAVEVDGRIVQWVVSASVWKDRTEQGPPDATGLAEEVVGSSPVNRTSALENAETSALGRALANLGYAPKGARPSREEMTKAVRQQLGPQPGRGDSVTDGPRDKLPPTPQQLRELGRLFDQAGLTSKDQVLDLVAGILGRPVTASHDLSRPEASRVIDHLHKLHATPHEDPA